MSLSNISYMCNCVCMSLHLEVFIHGPMLAPAASQVRPMSTFLGRRLITFVRPRCRVGACWWWGMGERRGPGVTSSWAPGRGQSILTHPFLQISLCHSISNFVSYVHNLFHSDLILAGAEVYLWYLEPTCRSVHHPSCVCVWPFFATTCVCVTVWHTLCDHFLPFLPLAWTGHHPPWNCRAPSEETEVSVHNHQSSSTQTKKKQTNEIQDPRVMHVCMKHVRIYSWSSTYSQKR